MINFTRMQNNPDHLKMQSLEFVYSANIDSAEKWQKLLNKFISPIPADTFSLHCITAPCTLINTLKQSKSNQTL